MYNQIQQYIQIEKSEINSHSLKVIQDFCKKIFYMDRFVIYWTYKMCKASYEAHRFPKAFAPSASTWGDESKSDIFLLLFFHAYSKTETKH